MLERGTAVEANAGHAGDREFYGQHITSLAGWVITGSTVYGAHYAVRKGLGVETGSSLGILIVPEANRVLCHANHYPSSKLVMPNTRSNRNGGIAPLYMRAVSNTGASPKSSANATA